MLQGSIASNQLFAHGDACLLQEGDFGSDSDDEALARRPVMHQELAPPPVVQLSKHK